MNMTVNALIQRANNALKGKPPLGGSICVAFPGAGVVYIYDNNTVAEIPAVAAADCTITLTLDTLAKLESGDESVVWAVINGDLEISGNRDLAEKFGALVQGAK